MKIIKSISNPNSKYNFFNLTHIALKGCNKRKVVADNHIFVYLDKTPNVTTLVLGSRPRQGFAKARAKRESRECGRV
jgi:hypothetical protein